MLRLNPVGRAHLAAVLDKAAPCADLDEVVRMVEAEGHLAPLSVPQCEAVDLPVQGIIDGAVRVRFTPAMVGPDDDAEARADAAWAHFLGGYRAAWEIVWGVIGELHPTVKSLSDDDVLRSASVSFAVHCPKAHAIWSRRARS